MQAAILNADTRTHIERIEKEKRNICIRLKSLIVADNLRLLDFSNKDERGFVEYYPGVFVRDITPELCKKEVTILHIMVKHDIKIDPHEHVVSSQSIMVKSGKVENIDTDVVYRKGNSFFIEAGRRHILKYFAGSEYFITFMPSLVEM
jgi:quercetin dioxygenase-like cupin family protein